MDCIDVPKAVPILDEDEVGRWNAVGGCWCQLSAFDVCSWAGCPSSGLRWCQLLSFDVCCRCRCPSSGLLWCQLFFLDVCYRCLRCPSSGQCRCQWWLLMASWPLMSTLFLRCLLSMRWCQLLFLRCLLSMLLGHWCPCSYRCQHFWQRCWMMLHPLHSASYT